MTLTETLKSIKDNNGGDPAKFYTLAEFINWARTQAGDMFATAAEIRVLLDDRAHGFDVVSDYLKNGLILIEKLEDDERDYLRGYADFLAAESKAGRPEPVNAIDNPDAFKAALKGLIDGSSLAVTLKTIAEICKENQNAAAEPGPARAWELAHRRVYDAYKQQIS